ncbi:hypothetical protein SAMN05216525_12966 [Bradyrhizobium sp. Gha]|nr:hypothetical protein SAMN05216525_12966 [Bradyrhizobium sp. Gha]
MDFARLAMTMTFIGCVIKGRLAARSEHSHVGGIVDSGQATRTPDRKFRSSKLTPCLVAVTPPGKTGLSHSDRRRRSGFFLLEEHLVMRVQSPCSLIISLVSAHVVIAPLLCSAAPIANKLGKLFLQRMPASFDSGHIVNELLNMTR